MTQDDQTPAKRVRKEDLSRLSERQLRLRKQVMDVGELAFGPRWQTDFAKALSHQAKREIGFSQVAHWISGHRPVPESLAEPIQRLTELAIKDAKRRAALIRADWSPETVAEREGDPQAASSGPRP